MSKNLKPTDLSEINSFLQSSSLADIIRSYRSWSFQEGDVLVRRCKILYQLDTVSAGSTMIKKFRVVKVDELGIPWVKQIRVKGGLGVKLYCLISYANNYEWEIDPAQIDAAILGYTYDPRANYKE